MEEPSSKNREQTILLRNCIIYALSWTIACLLATSWNIRQVEERTGELVEREARLLLDRELAIRYWAADHGGVYVASGDGAPPNPHLDDTFRPEVTLADGSRLRLLTPEAILRQIDQRYGELYRYAGQVSSLAPLDPAHAPDPWERQALEAFTRGRGEASLFTESADGEVFRLMKPLRFKDGCRDCHGQQNLTDGDLLGGIGIIMPMASFRAMEFQSLTTLYATHLFFWVSGMFIICLSFARNRQRMARRLAAEALLQEQSEKIQLFAYSVAHDLKNPVIAIESLARLLNRRQAAEMDDKSSQFCQQIEQSARQVSQLIEQINTYISSKEQPLAREPLDLAEVCGTVRSENEHRLRERGVHWTQPRGPVTLEADRMVILRILRNLVDNALKYGGDELRHVIISHKEEARFHTVRVINDGKPIAPEDCRLIFQRYKRTCADSKIEGTGLGLAIVRDLVGLHGGQVWVESDGVRGVAFSFTIAKPGRPPG